jgi:hypothetical protein
MNQRYGNPRKDCRRDPCRRANQAGADKKRARREKNDNRRDGTCGECRYQARGRSRLARGGCHCVRSGASTTADESDECAEQAAG